LNDEEYGVDINQVNSIETITEITRVPRTPAFVKGVINLRGTIVPVIDLRERFSLPSRGYDEQTRVIIVSVNAITVGMIVDSANDIIDIEESKVDPPPQAIGGIKAEYLKGIAKVDDRLLILLNLEKTLHPSEIVQLESFGVE
jgi:purine-binding chemotaxis protein CheW